MSRDSWNGGPYGGLGEAAGVFLWAVLFWAYFNFTLDQQPTFLNHLVQDFPIFNLLSAAAVGTPLLLGWIMLFQALGNAIVPSFTGEREAQPVFAYLTPACVLLFVALVVRIALITMNRMAAS